MSLNPEFDPLSEEPEIIDDAVEIFPVTMFGIDNSDLDFTPLPEVEAVPKDLSAVASADSSLKDDVSPEIPVTSIPSVSPETLASVAKDSGPDKAPESSPPTF
jgi:hypothetical protein